MTCGIYSIFWPSLGSVYVGRSINIERRLYDHLYRLRNGIHYNYKLIDMYTRYGEPETCILEECSTNELAELEKLWINEFSSVKEGLNIADGDGRHYIGTETGKSKYTKTTILKVFSLLYSSNLYLKDIAKKLNVPISLPTNILYNGQHMWLKDQYPKEYLTMLDKSKLRQSSSKSGFSNPMSKYSKRQILKVFSLLYRTTLSRQKIAIRTNTSPSISKAILDCGSHKWIKDEYPAEYSTMMGIRKKRK